MAVEQSPQTAAAEAAGGGSPKPAAAAVGGSPKPATAAGAQSLQEAAIAHFSAQAKALPPPDAAPLSEDSARKVAAILLDAVAHPGVFSFSWLVSLPVVSKLSGTGYKWYLDFARLFAYGNFRDYKRMKRTIPNLDARHILKLKQVTVLTWLESIEAMPLDKLMKEIEISNLKELCTFLTTFCEQLGLTGESMIMDNVTFQMKNMPIHRGFSTVIEESLEVFVLGAVHVVPDADTGLLRNSIVRQVKVPTNPVDPSKFHYQVEFEQLGSNVFSQIVILTTQAHLERKSWNGNIYPGMFVLVGEQVVLRPEAAATRDITSRNSANDYLAIEAMLKNFTGLKFRYIDRSGTRQEIMYPMYMGNLLKHLNGKFKQLTKAHKEDPMAKAMDRNYVVFLRCHSTFQTTAAMSVILYHVRCYQSTSNVTEKKDFDSALKTVKVRADWHSDLKKHWLFKGCFTFAESISADYENTQNGCCRLIRDWGTHCRKYLTEQEKQIFTEVVRVLLIEYYFADFVPEILYSLLCDFCQKHPDFDLPGFLVKLQRIML